MESRERKFTLLIHVIARISVCTSGHVHVGDIDTATKKKKEEAALSMCVPEAPCVDPKYYIQTVAITSKPEIPHSTFLIPAACLLSWAPHEEPLLERVRGHVSDCLPVSVSLSVLPLSS